MTRVFRIGWWLLGGLSAAVSGFLPAFSAESASLQELKIAHIIKIQEILPKLSNLEVPPEDDGSLGAKLGILDNNRSLKRKGFSFSHEIAVVGVDEPVMAVFQKFYADGVRHFISNMPADDLLALADSELGKSSWFYNIGAKDGILRQKECRYNILHYVPSYTASTDGLAQYLVTKRWDKWLMVVGNRISDLKFAEAVVRSAKKFGAKIILRKDWEYGPDLRRTAASTVPVFTQGIDYDVLVVADVVGEFGEYLMYRTWEPKVVVGTQGMVPVIWHRAHEQWGAAQIQSRYFKQFGLYMTPQDYSAWSVLRSVREALVRGKTGLDAQKIASFLRGEDFALAGYKGQKLSFRRWNFQLRQPILLASPKSLVSVSPQVQFLHERSQLDTLGFDKSESECRLSG